jgi:type II secretory pathway pseudopilin PulG
MKNQNGISLIALIITIIIIIVLAVLIIGSAVTTPEKASIAKFTNDITEIQQAVSTKVADNQMQYVTNPDSVDLNKGFTRIEVVGAPNDFKGFPLETGEEGTIQGYLVNLDTINMERSTLGQGYKEASIVEFGTTDAFVYDANGQVYYAKGYNEGTITSYSKEDAIEVSTKPINNTALEKGVNPPILGTGMVEVYWDVSNNEVVKGATGFDVANWYDYIAQTGPTANIGEGTSKWANAKLDGSYFVWIPRYAYKITYYTDSTKSTISATSTKYGSIDVLFLYGTSSTRYIDKETNTIKLLPSDYIVHPVFTANIGNGGWDSELTGIWIGKYEASHNDATSTVVGTSTTLKVVPTVKSWVSITTGDAYTRAKAYKPNLNSHMVKLSEWGAAAYLAHSKYGRNGTEVTINNNTNKLTGYAGQTVNTEDDTPTYAYNTPQGMLASTTGNIYGIYDMSGGIVEHSAAYCTLCTNGNLTTYGGSFVYEEDGVTISTTGTRFVTAYNELHYKNGDATEETKNFNDDFGGFCFSTTGAFTALGGGYYLGASSGIFFTPAYNGSAINVQGFRVCLCF